MIEIRFKPPRTRTVLQINFSTNETNNGKRTNFHCNRPFTTNEHRSKLFNYQRVLNTHLFSAENWNKHELTNERFDSVQICTAKINLYAKYLQSRPELEVRKRNSRFFLYKLLNELSNIRSTQPEQFRLKNTAIKKNVNEKRRLKTSRTNLIRTKRLLLKPTASRKYNSFPTKKKRK